MTPKTLIVLVDGSAYSESVCHHAAWIAERTGSKVKIYHVMGRRDAPGKQDLSGTIRLGARTRLLDQLSELDAQRAKLAHEHGRAILEDAAAIVKGGGEIEVETRLRQGDLIETITAKEDSGSMIVIGKRGEGAGLATGHLGSNIERIVRASHKPVYVANRAFAPIGRVLIAFDGGQAALKTVDFVARGELFSGLPVALVFAGPETPANRQALNDAVATLTARGFTPEAFLRPGEPETILSNMTANEGYDLLVMGASARSRVRALFIGSTSTEMIRSCKVPVLLVR